MCCQQTFNTLAEFNEIFSERLRRARVMRGLSMDSLCELLGGQVTKQTISKYEKGKMMPGSSNLILLSKALEVPMDYFFRDTNSSISQIEFRKKAKLGAKKIESIKEQIRDSVERYQEIENICGMNSVFDNPGDKIQVRELSDVYKVVSAIREDWKLGEDGIVNVVDLLEAHNVKVISIEAPEDAFDGLSGYINNNQSLPFVVINSNKPTERRRFAALHELGHIVMNFYDGIAQNAVISLLANC